MRMGRIGIGQPIGDSSGERVRVLGLPDLSSPLGIFAQLDGGPRGQEVNAAELGTSQNLAGTGWERLRLG